MDRKLNGKNFLEHLSLVLLLFLVLVLNLFDNNMQSTKDLLIIGLFPMILMIIYNMNSFKKLLLNIEGEVKPIFFFWVLFMVLISLSEIQNQQLSESVIYMALPFIIHIYDVKIKTFLTSLSISLIPFVFAAFIGSISGNKFTSNTIGLLVSAFMVLSFAIVAFLKPSRILILIYVLFDVLGFYSLIKINSRTSQLIVFTAMILLIVYYVMSFFKSFLEKGNFKTKHLILISLIVIVIFVFFLKDLLLAIISPKWNPNDISTGRFDIWLTTIKNYNLFGHSYTWYTDSGLFGPHKGPHNLFIGILGYAGALALIVFLMFLYSLVKYILTNRERNYTNEFISSLYIFLLTCVKGLTEGMIFNAFYHVYNIMFIISISYILIDFLSIDKAESKVTLEINTSYKVLSLLILFLMLTVTIYAVVLKFNLGFFNELLLKYLR